MKETQKEIEAKVDLRFNGYRLKPSQLKEVEGFNIRTDYADLESLARSIIQNGVIEPIKVRFLEKDAKGEQVFQVVQGHRRTRAAKMAVEMLQKEGRILEAEALVVPAIKVTGVLSEIDLLFMQFVGNDQENLKAHEVAEFIKRLVSLGMKPEQIAERIGKTQAYISQMLTLAAAAPTIKEAVANESLSASTAISIVRATDSMSEQIALLDMAKELEAQESQTLIEEGKESKKAGKVRAKHVEEAAEKMGKKNRSSTTKGVRVDKGDEVTRFATFLESLVKNTDGEVARVTRVVCSLMKGDITVDEFRTFAQTGEMPLID